MTILASRSTSMIQHAASIQPARSIQPAISIRPAASIQVYPGPLLLRGAATTPDLANHFAQWGPQPKLDLTTLLELCSSAVVKGRGGAGFPFARKLSTVAEHRRRGQRPVVVVNAAEGEPISAKDSALLLTSPHLVLDGAALSAHALGAPEVIIVTASDRPWVTRAVAAAIGERESARADRSLRWSHRPTAGRFVAGASQAVLEHLAGRAALPVTAWVPEAVRGVRGRPTLLSNAETFAQVAALARIGAEEYRALGTTTSPGTTLLTVARLDEPSGSSREPAVHEVGYGTPLVDLLPWDAQDGPVLLGGFHGTWASPVQIAGLAVDRDAFAERSLALGAGVLAPAGRACPVALTARITAYLADQSARRCGPCLNGLPALAESMAALAGGVDTRARIRELGGVVAGRGACAHPDGTARVVSSLLDHLPEAVGDHLSRSCSCTGGAR